MAPSTFSKLPSAIYVIGVPATGKTTLVETLADRIQGQGFRRTLCVIAEVARELVLREKINHRDITAGKDAAMDLQRRILEAQAMREREAANTAHLIVSDRSGVDPIAFATKYGGRSRGQALLDLEAWTYLRQRMRCGIVILCEPIPKWFVDDGVRVVPASTAEVNELHMTFYDILQSQEISFHTLPASIENTLERVDFVMNCWRQKDKSLL
ncbi:hypothetical protein H2198_006518 [Neophaeococcomyces mojaviensis]|uniref:Uncharacterized protein n=1 Tax=Neophaeococcomyces mojaviensis TaxID=3383035 RepID=A0ACC3A2R3_9EURO|nr:hypothetical protein H2198_006518 [Knufia sp. JES_112]